MCIWNRYINTIFSGLTKITFENNYKVQFNLELNLPAVLYLCETWTVTLREEQILWVFKYRVLERIFGLKRVYDKKLGSWVGNQQILSGGLNEPTASINFPDIPATSKPGGTTWPRSKCSLLSWHYLLLNKWSGFPYQIWKLWRCCWLFHTAVISTVNSTYFIYLY